MVRSFKSFKSSMRSKNENSTMLKQSQRDIEEQLSAIVAQLSAVTGQLERQADSTFGGNSWAAISLPGFASRLVTHGKALIELSKGLKSRALPQWNVEQNEAYKNLLQARLDKCDQRRNFAITTNQKGENRNGKNETATETTT
jgi:hypothetical protein